MGCKPHTKCKEDGLRSLLSQALRIKPVGASKNREMTGFSMIFFTIFMDFHLQKVI